MKPRPGPRLAERARLHTVRVLPRGSSGMTLGRHVLLRRGHEERAVLIAREGRIGTGDLPLAPMTREEDILERAAEERMTLEQLEAAYIRRVLQLVGGKKGEAARILGIHRKTLLEKRRRYGID